MNLIGATLTWKGISCLSCFMSLSLSLRVTKRFIIPEGSIIAFVLFEKGHSKAHKDLSMACTGIVKETELYLPLCCSLVYKVVCFKIEKYVLKWPSVFSKIFRQGWLRWATSSFSTHGLTSPLVILCSPAYKFKCTPDGSDGQRWMTSQSQVNSGRRLDGRIPE